MKELTLKDKDAIREALTDYTRNYPSQNRAAESMKGVSAATISQVVNGKYQNISDDMFARIAQQIGYSMDRWAIVESQTWQRITFAMTDAQQWKNVSWWWATPDAARPPPPSSTAARTATCSTSSAQRTCARATSCER